MRAHQWTAVAAALTTLACNGGLEPTPVCGKNFVGVCGTVTFRVPLPDSLKDSTAQVLLLAYARFPTRTADLFTFQPRPVPFTVPLAALGGPPYFYALALPSDRYEWILAVWQKKSTAPLSPQNADTLLREVGFYRDGADTTSHGSGIVTVTSTGIGSIDFEIDFSQMHRICDYFPPCP